MDKLHFKLYIETGMLLPLKTVIVSHNKQGRSLFLSIYSAVSISQSKFSIQSKYLFRKQNKENITSIHVVLSNCINKIYLTSQFKLWTFRSCYHIHVLTKNQRSTNNNFPNKGKSVQKKWISISNKNKNNMCTLNLVIFSITAIIFVKLLWSLYWNHYTDTFI